MTNTAPAPAPAAFDAWHDDASAACAARGFSIRDFDASDAEEAFTDGVSPAAYAAALEAALDD